MLRIFTILSTLSSFLTRDSRVMYPALSLPVLDDNDGSRMESRSCHAQDDTCVEKLDDFNDGEVDDFPNELPHMLPKSLNEAGAMKEMSMPRIVINEALRVKLSSLSTTSATPCTNEIEHLKRGSDYVSMVNTVLETVLQSKKMENQELLRELLWKAKEDFQKSPERAEQSTRNKKVSDTENLVLFFTKFYSAVRYANTNIGDTDKLKTLIAQAKKPVQQLEDSNPCKSTCIKMLAVLEAGEKFTLPDISSLEQDRLFHVGAISDDKKTEVELKHLLEKPHKNDDSALKKTSRPKNTEELVRQLQKYPSLTETERTAQRKGYQENRVLAFLMINQFLLNPILTQEQHQEVLLLAKTKDREIISTLLKAFIAKLEVPNARVQINYNLWGLAATLEYCTQDNCEANDFVDALTNLQEQLAKIHKQERNPEPHLRLLFVMSRVLDAMINNDVYNVNRLTVQEPAQASLSTLDATSIKQKIQGKLGLAVESIHPRVNYQSNYAMQALARISNDETQNRKGLRYIISFGKVIYGIYQASHKEFMEAYSTFLNAEVPTSDILDDISGLKLWVDEVRMARALLSRDLVTEFENFIRNEAESLWNEEWRSYFLRGVVYALHDRIATHADERRADAIRCLCFIATRSSFGCDNTVRQEIVDCLNYYLQDDPIAIKQFSEDFPSLFPLQPSAIKVADYLMPVTREETQGASTNTLLVQVLEIAKLPKSSIVMRVVAEEGRIIGDVNVDIAAVSMDGLEMPAQHAMKPDELAELGKRLLAGQAEAVYGVVKKISDTVNIDMAVVAGAAVVQGNISGSMRAAKAGRIKVYFGDLPASASNPSASQGSPTSSPNPSSKSSGDVSPSMLHAFTASTSSMTASADTSSKISVQQPRYKVISDLCRQIVEVLDRCGPEDQEFREGIVAELKPFQFRTDSSFNEQERKQLTELLEGVKLSCPDTPQATSPKKAQGN